MRIISSVLWVFPFMSIPPWPLRNTHIQRGATIGSHATDNITFPQKRYRLYPLVVAPKKLTKGFYFLGYRVVPGRRLRSSAQSQRRFAEKFRRLYEQGASNIRLWRYAQRWWRWHRAGLDGRVALKGGLKRVVIRQLRMLGIVGFPIPRYDAQTGTWQTQKTSDSG